jgi:uncharacterized membrane protein
MDTLPNPFKLLPGLDWLALIGFFAGWIGYATFAGRQAYHGASLLGITNRIRREWMLQATWRDNRILDGSVVQTLSSSPSFFASTSILIIGGLLAALSASGQTAQVMGDIPFAVRTSGLVFELKLALLTAVFVYAFFCFSWSLRQYTFGALLLAALPDPARITASGMSREAFADRAGRVVGIAAESFNNGLRSYYLSFAVVGWFFSPLVFMVGTAGVIWVLYQREFHSEVLAMLDPGS